MNKSVESSDFFLGPPKSWVIIDDDNVRSSLTLVNPNYHLGDGYKGNCVNCVIAYDLRMRGYDVTARPRNECNVSKKADKLWLNVFEQEAGSIHSVIDNIDKTVDARYFLGVKYADNNGHALIIRVENKIVSILDPQIGIRYKIESLCGSDLAFSFWRIDNLEVSQTGYNACKGGVNI